MSQTHYADASGVDPATVSTATDQLRIAQVVMRNRTMREVVAMPQAVLPAAGTVYNVNFMVGKQGISGVKTGSTLAAGSCFVGSFPITVDGKPRLLLGAVLGQRSLHDALAYDTAMLHAIAPQFKTYRVPTPKTALATAWRQQVPLTPARPLQVFGYPGMPIKLQGGLTQAELPIKAGQAVGNLALATGEATESFELRASRAVEAPGVWWRLVR
jgi:D-alanyl-D-alanine carboxypeptidase (penicillin-binding protein 5/6)